jgi:hypothetical protein
MKRRRAIRSQSRPMGRSVSPDDLQATAWPVDLEVDTSPVENDPAVGSQVDWDEQGRPVFTVFFGSGATRQYVDDARAWRAVEVFGVTRPPARRPN